MGFELNAQGKALLVLIGLLLAVVITWGSREVLHTRSDAAWAVKMDTAEKETVEALEAKEDFRQQTIRLASQIETTRRAMASSEDSSRSFTREVRPDGSSLVRIDSSIKKRLDQTEEQVKLLASQWMAETQKTATLQQSLNDRVKQVSTLESQVASLTLDSKKGGKRVGLLIGAGLDSPWENPRVGGAGFLGPFMATITADPSPIWNRGKGAAGQVMLGFCW